MDRIDNYLRSMLSPVTHQLRQGPGARQRGGPICVVVVVLPIEFVVLGAAQLAHLLEEPQLILKLSDAAKPGRSLVRRRFAARMLLSRKHSRRSFAAGRQLEARKRHQRRATQIAFRQEAHQFSDSHLRTDPEEAVLVAVPIRRMSRFADRQMAQSAAYRGRLAAAAAG